MKNKENLVELDRNYVWHPFTQMKDWVSEEPVIIEKGEGSWLIDVKGNRYLDGVSSIWAIIHGHNRKKINTAIEKQIKQISHSTMLGLANVPATLLAEKLVKIAPGNLKKVFYSDSGSTAVEIGLKMAYQYWQQKDNPVPTKQKFAKLTNAYHGDTIGSVSLGGMDLFHKIFHSLLFNTYDIPAPFFYHSDFKTEEDCKNHSLECIKKLFEEKSDEIAGFFIEAYVQGAAGMIVYPKGFMKEVQKLCQDYNVLLIADEVHTGFGRTGKMFACEEDQLEPDIMAVAKGITGGYLPLAATLTTDEIYNAFLGEFSDLKTFFHGHTYTGNPVACSAALASLDIFEVDNTLDQLQDKISILTEGLNEIAKMDHVGDIRQKGMMIGIELVKNKKNKENYPFEQRMAHKVCMEARNHHAIIRNLGDVVILMPPLSISIEEIKLLLSAVTKSINIVTGS